MNVIVSNRLPVVIQRNGASMNFAPTIGGLATGLRSFHERVSPAWVGWPGPVGKESERAVERRLRNDFRCYPVFLTPAMLRGYYSGFSNGTLWPLLHSFPSYGRYSSSAWRAYKKVNALFAEQVASLVKPGDTVWVHDYHLMLLPQYIREYVPSCKIGFFLHTPFPHYDTFELIPWHRELVKGMLGADLIGFHTYDYAQSFLGSVRHFLGMDNRIGQLIIDHRSVQVDAFPLGIDFEDFARASERPGVRAALRRARRQVRDMRTIFSISRLDYTKGIPQQLLAVQRLLEAHPEMKGKFVHLCVVVPSRERVDLYGRLKREIDELVGRINGKFGTIDWTPIRYVYRRLDQDELNALYLLADVALVMPLRDGMNLVAKEYVASRNDETGVLVLSEMAGASKEMLEGLIVNPNDDEAIAGALYEGLTMPIEEQARRNRIMRSRLEKTDSEQWAERFLDRLEESVSSSRSLSTMLMSQHTKSGLRKAFRASRKRAFLLDYDGTLVPFASKPSEAAPSPRVQSVLRSLASSRRNEVYLISGRVRADLERWFGDAPLSLVAEHGAWFRAKGSGDWKPLAGTEPRWKNRIRPVLELFTDRIPGSSIEEKDFSMAWHYRESDIESGAMAAKELIDALTHLTANLDIGVMAGNKVVEVKSTQVNKGLFYSRYLASRRYGFMFCAGDDETDEFLFEVLPSKCISVKVGISASSAKYSVDCPDAVLAFLENLVNVDSQRGVQRST